MGVFSCRSAQKALRLFVAQRTQVEGATVLPLTRMHTGFYVENGLL
jgi:hypothetical protein